ncbi:MAG: hypothetical protein IJ764_00515 [Bacteroidales bacterium]|nr:hypothetical protein [Bacteroidales bacterium]
MTRQSFYNSSADWEVTVYYESDRDNAGEILHSLDIAGCDDETYFLAMDNLEHGARNSGLTFSNMKTRESIIVLSKTTSRKEFANTWFHELIHCAIHIATALGLDYQGETMAYIGGDLAMAMQPAAARLMCPHCPDLHHERLV